MLVCLSLGSNWGDRARHLAAALRALDALPGVDVAAVSEVYETAPWGFADQPAFLNMAAVVETACNPLDLLPQLKAIEAGQGRVSTVKWGPRPLDLDIILWASRIVDDEALRIPHRHYRDRAFVLIPLAEIAPEAVDPETGETVRELAGRFANEPGVTRLGPLGSF